MALTAYWKMALEISILWYAMYLILLFVKGTRSEQLLKGLFIIGLVFVVSQQLRLDAITWALTRLVPISVIALIVVFQPELRRGLAQLGRFGIQKESAGVVDEIASAAAALSKKRLGALVVIERESGLKSHVETGVPLGARVSRQLIESIFTDGSPLHDGAIIIQNGAIAAAGCVLPLSQDEKSLPRPLGMRHRASIGITEDTDAVCVVVSEETGALSLAADGRLTHGLDASSLARAMRAALDRGAGEQSFIGDLAARSWRGRFPRRKGP